MVWFLEKEGEREKIHSRCFLFSKSHAPRKTIEVFPDDTDRQFKKIKICSRVRFESHIHTYDKNNTIEIKLIRDKRTKRNICLKEIEKKLRYNNNTRTHTHTIVYSTF